MTVATYLKDVFVLAIGHLDLQTQASTVKQLVLEVNVNTDQLMAARVEFVEPCGSTGPTSSKVNKS